jgi:hypothetical protein
MKSCQNCGAEVTQDYARVFGDNDNEVHGCTDCTQNSRGVDAKETAAVNTTF